MSQQLAIIAMIDIPAALKAKSLKDNIYLFDNMKRQGSENEGTNRLITAVNGSCWGDGSVADEPVLNWLSGEISSTPPTLPKTFSSDRAKNSEQLALRYFIDLKGRIEDPKDEAITTVENVKAELARIADVMGVVTRHENKSKEIPSTSFNGEKILDSRGEVIRAEVLNNTRDPNQQLDINYPPPVLIDITGEAVDKKVIYPAQYGSPDMVSDGWYWSATVDASKPGTYAYIMHFKLSALGLIDGNWSWIPVTMQHQAYIKVARGVRRNGFTGADVGLLPITAPPDSLGGF